MILRQIRHSDKNVCILYNTNTSDTTIDTNIPPLQRGERVDAVRQRAATPAGRAVPLPRRVYQQRGEMCASLAAASGQDGRQARDMGTCG